MELYEELQEFRKILCVCPCCGEIVRVSDLKLRVKGKVTKTWLDEYEKMQQTLEKKEEIFAEKEIQLRDIAREKGRREAEKLFNNAVSKVILPSFKALKLDPFDVKPILNPVDFIVFNGMTKQETISDIMLLSKQHDAPALTTVRKQIEQAIIQKKYEWQVARIDEKGKILFE
jgi:predicted Holliday junction resolvase-like endonuclease